MLSKVIRVHRKDSAFVYAILESLEGMASYSTLDSAEGGQAYRDLRLVIADGYIAEVEEVLNGLRKKFPVLELPTETNGSSSK